MNRERERPAFYLGMLVPIALASFVAADQTVSLVAVQDAFVREQEPASNFGAAGMLCVAGPNSVNGIGEPRGRFDTVIKFDASAVTTFNTAYGAGNWVIRNVLLQAAEVAAPENTFFPRGVGTFGISWLSDATWTEGTGTPNAPTQGAGGEITWQSLQTILTSAVEAPLGAFSNLGSDGMRQYALTLDYSFVTDLSSGGIVSLHVFPQRAYLGFTFHSQNFSDTAARPQLLVTAGPVIRGDMNCDGILDLQDVAPFALCLVNPSGYASSYPGCVISQADMNRDGIVDGRDIRGFAAGLLTPQ